LERTDNHSDADSDSHPKPQVAHGKAESNTGTGADRDPNGQSLILVSLVFMAGLMCQAFTFLLLEQLVRYGYADRSQAWQDGGEQSRVAFVHGCDDRCTPQDRIAQHRFPLFLLK